MLRNTDARHILDMLQVQHTALSCNTLQHSAIQFRLAVKKFGHPARMKKIKLKKIKRNKPKMIKNLIKKMGNRDIAAV